MLDHRARYRTGTNASQKARTAAWVRLAGEQNASRSGAAVDGCGPSTTERDGDVMASRARPQVAWLPEVMRGRAMLLSRTALGTVATLLLATPGRAQPAPNARPGGGVVTAGSASIGSSASTTTITQTQPAGGDQLAELQCRVAPDGGFRAAVVIRGGAEPGDQSEPVADRRADRRQRADHPDQPVRRDLLPRARR